MVLPYVESSVSKACTSGGPSSWKKTATERLCIYKTPTGSKR